MAGAMAIYRLDAMFNKPEHINTSPEDKNLNRAHQNGAIAMNCRVATAPHNDEMVDLLPKLQKLLFLRKQRSRS